ncbi:MAG TPA: peptidoglycan bridge formation glycyltransferase FemA/FemB family protein [Ignavibacteriales bacterium]|nr:peptidoglycan bridge formation glycyltransferase FemA/FemB family protein [Ignavibacteriales bacterium]
MKGYYFILTSIDSWQQFFFGFQRSIQDIYYTYSYYFIYEKNGDGKAQCFVFTKDGDIALYPFLKNSINKLGYKLDHEYFDIQGAYGYNGVLSSSNDDKFRDAFYKAFYHYCKENNIIAEFTRFHPIFQNQKFSEGYMDIFLNRKTVVLDISPLKEDIWINSYSSTNRNMIRKARKHGIEIFEGSSLQDYKIFYSIYIETMDNVKSDKYLYFNEKYFVNFKRFLNNNHKLILAKYQNEIIGGMILMYHGDYAHYHLSSRKTEFGKVAVNNIFLDYAIDVAKQLGCKYFHLGGGTTSNENDSLLKFKSNFSKDRAEFYIGKKIHNKSVYNIVIKQWEEMYPESFQKNKHLLLGYREI